MAASRQRSLPELMGISEASPTGEQPKRHHQRRIRSVQQIGAQPRSDKQRFGAQPVQRLATHVDDMRQTTRKAHPRRADQHEDDRRDRQRAQSREHRVRRAARASQPLVNESQPVAASGIRRCRAGRGQRSCRSSLQGAIAQRDQRQTQQLHGRPATTNVNRCPNPASRNSDAKTSNQPETINR